MFGDMELTLKWTDSQTQTNVNGGQKASENINPDAQKPT